MFHENGTLERIVSKKSPGDQNENESRNHEDHSTASEELVNENTVKKSFYHSLLIYLCFYLFIY